MFGTDSGGDDDLFLSWVFADKAECSRRNPTPRRRTMPNRLAVGNKRPTASGRFVSGFSTVPDSSRAVSSVLSHDANLSTIIVLSFRVHRRCRSRARSVTYLRSASPFNF